jgi:hypothetical protein
LVPGSVVHEGTTVHHSLIYLDPVVNRYRYSNPGNCVTVVFFLLRKMI